MSRHSLSIQGAMTMKRFPDGAMVGESSRLRGRWLAWWADGTPLRSDNDETSFFKSEDEAIAALIDGGEGPGAYSPPTFQLQSP